MLAAASLAFIVAVALAAGPRVMYALLLGPSWQVPAYRPWAARTFFVAFCGLLIASGAVGLATAAWIGASLVTVELAYYGAIAGKARRLQLACKGLLDPATREASLAYVGAQLEQRKKKGERSPAHYPGYARTAMVLASQIDAAGLPAAAIHTLEDIDESRLDPVMRAMRAQNLAAFHMRSGGRGTARQVLARVPRPVPDPMYEDALAALEALLLALDGDPKDAEARARSAIDETKTPNVLASWKAALAHALAAQGARDEAIALLRQMRVAFGPPALERVARHGGAASPLAESLRAETGAPYR